MAGRSFASQKVSLILENTSGVEGSNAKRLPHATWEITPDAEVDEITSVGVKYATGTILHSEDTKVGVKFGAIGFNELPYILAASQVRVTSGSVVGTKGGQKWDFASDSDDEDALASYALYQGNNTSGKHRVKGVTFDEFELKIDLKSVEVSAKGFGKPLEDSNTATITLPTPVPVKDQPIVTKNMCKVYMSTTLTDVWTSNAPAATPTAGKKLTNLYSATLKVGDRQGAEYVIDADQGTGWVDRQEEDQVKAELKIEVQANAQGMTPLQYLRAGTRVYFRFDFIGPKFDAAAVETQTFQWIIIMAAEVKKPGTYKKNQRAMAIPYDFVIVHDDSFGYALWHRVQCREDNLDTSTQETTVQQ
jgi:hypothetical protein